MLHFPFSHRIVQRSIVLLSRPVLTYSCNNWLVRSFEHTTKTRVSRRPHGSEPCLCLRYKNTRPHYFAVLLFYRPARPPLHRRKGDKCSIMVPWEENKIISHRRHLESGAVTAQHKLCLCPPPRFPCVCTRQSCGGLVFFGCQQQPNSSFVFSSVTTPGIVSPKGE